MAETTKYSPVRVHLLLADQKEVRFGETYANGQNYVAIRGPSSLAGSYTLTLPTTAPSAGETLVADDEGNLDWAYISGGTVSHNTLAGLQGGAEDEYYHLTEDEHDGLHVPVTVADTTTINMSLTGQQVSGAVIPAGISHNDLAGHQGGAVGEYYHLTEDEYEGLVWPGDFVTLQASSPGTADTGHANISGNLVAGGDITLVPTTSSTTGIIYKSTSRFLHNFTPATANGKNTFLGLLAGNFTMSPGGGAATLASQNTAVGADVLPSLTTGYENTAVGVGAMANTTTGNRNTAIGVSALAANTIGDHNIAVGQNALVTNTEGTYNTALGIDALHDNLTGTYNVAVGQNALLSNTTASYNTAVGVDALRSNTSTGQYNTALGAGALYKNTTGFYNVALGSGALHEVTTHYSNTAVGTFAGYSNDWSCNVFLGYMAGYYETGQNKLFIDNAQRASEPDARAKALVYGIFDAATANQYLTFNANVTALHSLNSGPLTINGATTKWIHIDADEIGGDYDGAITTSGDSLFVPPTVYFGDTSFFFQRSSYNGIIQAHQDIQLQSGDHDRYYLYCIDSTGYVGISTAIPDSPLHVTGAIHGSTCLELGADQTVQFNAYYDSGWKYRATDGAVQLGVSTGDFYTYTAPSGTAGNPIAFTERMHIKEAGGIIVGSNTASVTPAAALHVVERSGSGMIDALFVSAGAATYNSGPRIVLNDWFGAGGYPTWRLADIGGEYASGSYGGELVFRVNHGDTVTDMLEAGRFETTGLLSVYSNVELGTLAPSNTYYAVPRGWIDSRGQNLVSNGSGLLGSNYNFSATAGGNAFTFDATETHGGGGSFKYTSGYGWTCSDELMPVDTSRRYRLSLWAKCGDVGGGDYNASNMQYAGVVPYDIDELVISPYCVMKYPGSTDTTLAATLNPNDSIMYVTDVTGWCNSGYYYQRNFCWYPYTNSKGYSYPDYTYTRLMSPSYSDYGSNGLWADGGINESTGAITLRNPWAGPTLAAGTAIRNQNSGGSYKYITMSGTSVPNEWTQYEGYIDDVDTTWTDPTNNFRYGTAFVRLLFLMNYQGVPPANTVRFSDVWFSELSSYNLEEASASSEGIVNLTTQQLGAGNKYVGSDFGVGTIPSYSLHVSRPLCQALFSSSTTTNESILYLQNGSGSTILMQENSVGGTWTNSLPYAAMVGHSSAQALQFGTASTVRMTIASNGDITLGTAASGTKLTIAGKTGTSWDYVFSTQAGNYLSVKTASSGAAELFIDYSGKIGIGATETGYILGLTATGTDGGLHITTASSTVTSPVVYMQDGGRTMNAEITSYDGTYTGLYIGTYSNHPILFGINAGSTPTSKWQMTADGNFWLVGGGNIILESGAKVGYSAVSANTGMYVTNVPQVSLQVAGTDKLYATSSYVYINTTPNEYYLPAARGNSGDVLTSNGSGGTSWSAPSSGTVDKIEEGNSSVEVIDTASAPEGEVVFTIDGEETVVLSAPSVLGHPSLSLDTTTVGEAFSIDFKYQGGDPNYDSSIIFDGNNSYFGITTGNTLDYIGFFPSIGGNTNYPSMRINKGTGAVLVGDTSPSLGGGSAGAALSVSHPVVFTRVWYYNASTYTNNTAEASSTHGTAFTIANVLTHYTYVGRYEATFDTIYIAIATAGVGVSLTKEYWDGDSWEALTVSDGTSNLTQSGAITFNPPGDWASTTVNSIEGYYVRLGTSGSASTAATAYTVVPYDEHAFEVFTHPADANPSLQVDREHGYLCLGGAAAVGAVSLATSTAAAGGISFGTDASIYRSASAELVMATSDTARMTINSTSATFAPVIRAPTSTVNAPGFAFSADADTGLFLNAGTPSLQLVVGGTGLLDLYATAFTSYGPVFRSANGSTSSCAYGFQADIDSGIYSVGSGDWWLVSNGTGVAEAIGGRFKIGPSGANYVMPNTLGSDGQILATDGGGTASWSSDRGGFRASAYAYIGSAYTIDSFALGSYFGCVWHYVASSSDTNIRAGTVRAAWNTAGSSVVYDDTTTSDIGDTSALSFAVDFSTPNIRLRATTTSGTYQVKVKRIVI